MADGDAPGQRGAGNLAAVLLAYCPAVRIITPPAGAKDARAWKRAGATAADVQAVIDAAPVRRLAVKTSVRKRKAGGSMDGEANGLTIECSPSGRNGTATLTARLGGEVLAVETLDLTKPKTRQDFRRHGLQRTARHRPRGHRRGIVAAGGRPGKQAGRAPGGRGRGGNRRFAPCTARAVHSARGVRAGGANYDDHCRSAGGALVVAPTMGGRPARTAARCPRLSTCPRARRCGFIPSRRNRRPRCKPAGRKNRARPG